MEQKTLNYAWVYSPTGLFYQGCFKESHYDGPMIDILFEDGARYRTHVANVILSHKDQA